MPDHEHEMEQREAVRRGPDCIEADTSSTCSRRERLTQLIGRLLANQWLCKRRQGAGKTQRSRPKHSD